MSETENEDEEISTFAATAIRAPRKGTFEQILSQHLILSVTAKPLKKVRLIAEAAMMVSDKIENQDELKNISRVARAFESASYTKLDRWGTVMYFIPWDFPGSEENFAKFIKPWHVHVSYFPKFIKLHHVTGWKLIHDRPWSRCRYVLATCKKDEIEDAIKKLLAKYEYCPSCHEGLRARDIRKQEITFVTEEPLWSFFFEMSRTCLSEVGFKMLRNAFINYALPKVQEAVKTLSDFVTPQQYQDMLKLLTNQREDHHESPLGKIE